MIDGVDQQFRLNEHIRHTNGINIEIIWNRIIRHCFISLIETQKKQYIPNMSST